MRVDGAQHRELAEHYLVGRQGNERPARHSVNGHIDGYLRRMCFHRAGDLHCRENQTARRVQDEIDGHVPGRLLDCGDDRLCILEVDVARLCEAEEAALLLTMNHGDDAAAVLFLYRANGLGAPNRVPASHEQRLKRHERKQDEENGGDVECHGLSFGGAYCPCAKLKSAPAAISSSNTNSLALEIGSWPARQAP